MSTNSFSSFTAVDGEGVSPRISDKTNRYCVLTVAEIGRVVVDDRIQKWSSTPTIESTIATILMLSLTSRYDY